MPPIDQAENSSSGLSLAIRLRAGSSEAWRELVDLYGPLVESWCRRAGLPEAARGDVGQEVFLAVHRGIAKFDPQRPQATFRGWLWTITRNAVLEWLRRRGPEPAGGSTALERLADIPDPWENASSDEPPSTADESASLLRRALDQIPADRRAADLERLLEHRGARASREGRRSGTRSGSHRRAAGQEPPLARCHSSETAEAAPK